MDEMNVISKKWWLYPKRDPMLYPKNIQCYIQCYIQKMLYPKNFSPLYSHFGWSFYSYFTMDDFIHDNQWMRWKWECTVHVCAKTQTLQKFDHIPVVLSQSHNFSTYTTQNNNKNYQRYTHTQTQHERRTGTQIILQTGGDEFFFFWMFVGMPGKQPFFVNFSFFHQWSPTVHMLFHFPH